MEKYLVLKNIEGYVYKIKGSKKAVLGPYTEEGVYITLYNKKAVYVDFSASIAFLSVLCPKNLIRESEQIVKDINILISGGEL